MRSVSSEFKTAINSYGREITVEVSISDTVYRDSDIVSVNYHFDGALLSSVMQCMDIELDGVGGEAFAASLANQTLSVRFGVRAEGDFEYQYVDFGQFIVKESSYNADTNSVYLECYDSMLLAMVPYVPVCVFSDASGNLTTTLGDYLAAIAAKMGLSLTTESFVNSDVYVDGEKYDETYTFRDVLTEIAQAAAGTIAIQNNALSVLYPTETNEVIRPSDLMELSVKEAYGPVNSVVLARTPQEDNIYKRDEAATEWIEWRVENNQIMDSHREDFIDGIYSALSGLSFQIYEMKSFGIGYLFLCDRFTVEDLDGNQYSTIFLSDDLMIDQGISETCESVFPGATQTDYIAASPTDRVLNQTILRVNKQAQTIEALITHTENVENELTGQIENLTKSVETKMTSEQVEILVKSQLDGINSITTATGYKFDKDGLRISKSGEEMENLLDNTGMYVNRGADNILTANNEGVNAINLSARQYLIVGTNSRFEDYDFNRTACFYIGG